MAVEYSLNNYHSTPDHADLSLPDGDWFWAVIARPNVDTFGQDILSTGEWGVAGTYNFYQFEDVFGFKYATSATQEISTVSPTDWVLLVAQRSSGNVTLRSVPMGGSTVTASAGVSVSGSINPSDPLMIGRRSDSGAAPFLGAVSDAFFVPGSTISNSDMQNIADGTTAIDQFSWYGNAVFWAIPETSTNTDHIGSKTLTVNGTVSTASDPVDLVRFGVTDSELTASATSSVNFSLETETGNLAAVYSSGNNHTIADDPGMTLPNNDWTWLVTVRTGSDITTGQDIFVNGIYQTANVFDLYIAGSTIGLDINNLGPDEFVSCSTNTWYLVAATRSGGTFTVRAIPFGSGTVSESSGTAISSAYDSSTGYSFGRDSAGNFPLLGGRIGDALFLPGEAVSNADLISIARDNDALNSFSWWSSREFHLVAAESTDLTGNHTVTKIGDPTIASGPSGFVRIGGTSDLSAAGVGGFSGVGATTAKSETTAASVAGFSGVGSTKNESDLSAAAAAAFSGAAGTKFIAELTAAGTASASFDGVTGITELTAAATGAASFDLGALSKSEMTAAGTSVVNINVSTDAESELSASGSASLSADFVATAESILSAPGVGGSSFISDSEKANLSAPGVGGFDFDIGVTVENILSAPGVGGFSANIEALKPSELTAIGAGAFSFDATGIKPSDINAPGIGGFSGDLVAQHKSDLSAAGSSAFNVDIGTLNKAELSAPGVGGSSLEGVSRFAADMSGDGVSAAGFLGKSIAVPVTITGSNFYIIPENFIDDPDTLTATTTASGFDIDNIKSDIKSKVWRSTATTAQTITATWTETKLISAVGFAFSNLVEGSTVQIKLYTNAADVSAAYDSGATSIDFAYDPPSGFASIGLDSFAFGGGNYFSKLFATVPAKKIEIIVVSSGNPDGYIEISRIICGTAYTPTIGAGYGAEISFDDMTATVLTDSGDTFTNRGAVKKSLSFNLNVLVPISKHGLMNVIKNRGANHPVFASLYENSQIPEERASFMIYGRFDTRNSMNISSKDIYNSTISITEV